MLADISFKAPERAAQAAEQQSTITAGSSSSSSEGSSEGSSNSAESSGEGPVVRHEVTAADVQAAVGELLKKVDLSKYML